MSSTPKTILSSEYSICIEMWQLAIWMNVNKHCDKRMEVTVGEGTTGKQAPLRNIFQNQSFERHVVIGIKIWKCIWLFNVVEEFIGKFHLYFDSTLPEWIEMWRKIRLFGTILKSSSGFFKNHFMTFSCSIWSFGSSDA